MSSLTLKSVISQLKSDKSKDRQQGLTSLREAFSRNNVVETFDPEGDGKHWLIVFQALFTAVLNERGAALRKGGSAAERRLKDAAAVVRWLTERSVTRWTTKVAKPLVKHLLQTMVHNGRLFMPVALDYVKALRVIYAYTPHRDHLLTKIEQWMPILSLSFAVVLDDDLKSGLDGEPEVSSEAEVSMALSGDEDTPARKRRKLELSHAELRTPRSATPRTVSPEQIEFVALIAMLLRSPRMQLLSSEHIYLADAVLNRLGRFFKLYQDETSAHLDAIDAVNSVLNSVGLNARDEVISFSVTIWDQLLCLWSTKSKSMKEGILIVLKMILPYIAHANAHQFDKADGLNKLLRRLQADSGSRWGFDDLQLDSLRLEVLSTTTQEPFVARTFRAGYNFSKGQASAWANLELVADVVKELYLLSESSHSSSPDNKRNRLEHPIKSLLQSAQQSRSVRGKAYALQSLIFVIDRHWTTLHAEMQVEVISGLLQMITTDDTTLQSWVFCCFAAIAYVDTSSSDRLGDIASNRWDTVWSHSMRRTNAPVICRAACHAAHVLLIHAKVPMTRILAEIETMAQDINVQGPGAPFDSVCAFLGRCVKVASQDARLYRMHLDDKVLSWLIENWNILGTSRSTSNLSQLRLEQHTVQDILNLLENACGFFVSQLCCSNPLPRHAIVDFVQSQIDTAVIRDFLLDAHFPDSRLSPVVHPSSTPKPSSLDHRGDLIQPDARTRKVSAFFLKTLESIIPVWEETSDPTLRPPAEGVRRALDFAVLVICFESSALMNGIANNRRSLLAACKLITLLAPQLIDLGWSADELATLLASFSPLSSEGLEDGLSSGWAAFIEPGKATGVKQPVGGQVACDSSSQRYSSRRLLQSVIWQSSDVQDALASVLSSLKRILKTFVEEGKALDKHLSPVVEDDRDGFGPIRTTNAPSLATGQEVDDRGAVNTIVRMCVDHIALAPVLRSVDGQIVKDKTLIDLVCSCSDVEKFQVMLQPFLWHVRQHNIRLTASNIDALLTYVEFPLTSYSDNCSDSFHVSVIQLLDATVHVWRQNSFPAETASKVRAVIEWLANHLKNGNLSWWRTRDVLGRFWDHYLTLDPSQDFLAHQNEEALDMDSEKLPDKLLPFMTKDDDIRVRFTAALCCGRLFSAAYIRANDPMEVYTNIREQLCCELNKYEHMLTRFICLGNILISSSSVRRGPYWHLLETCLYSDHFNKHVESVLRIAAEKMGLSRFPDLFESYASQIAYSIRISGQDFFRLPPHLLGYRDRKECAEATFSAFSPTNLLARPEEDDDFAHRRGPFFRHCRMLDKAPIDGLLSCFADLVGYYVVFWIDDHRAPILDSDQSIRSFDVDTSGLLESFQTKFVTIGSADYIRQLIVQNVDGITCSILRTNGDLDYRRDGSIVKTFEDLNKPERSVRAYRALMQFRGHSEFDMHAPNLPSFSSGVVLMALDWLCNQVETTNSASTTYHVMQQFFATIAMCPLINEQLRLLTCLCIWISLAYAHFKGGTLLRVLMNGAAALLAQSELSGIAQGMLDWAFIHLREIQRDTPHIVEILIRICSISCELLSSDDDPIRKTGMRLKTWIEAQVVSLAEVETIRKRIAVSLAAWPIELSDRLLSIMGDLGYEELSNVLDDPYLSHHKFKIVRRLSDLAKTSSYNKYKFAGHDFWRLRDSIPLSSMIPDEVDAFTSLLIANSGYIRSQTVDQSYGRSIGTRQLKLNMGKNGGSVKRPIVHALLDLLTDQAPRAVHVAYRTLRQLAGNESLDSMDYGSWPAEYRGDVSFLDFCPTKEVGSAPQNMSDIKQPRFTQSATNFSQWISELTSFFAKVLSANDRFYAHLSSILSENTEFATQMFPVLIHSLLLCDPQRLGTSDGPSYRTLLSGYLSGLVAYPDLDVLCHRSVINLILHLRQFKPGASDDELAYNQWLDLDFMLLSRSAIKCGAYTTALLFLELAVEYRQNPGADDRSSEQILFDIYSHIDEPDGFYGIKTVDLQDFLLRRFRHERQWDKAFQFYGASFEAGNGDPRGSGGIIESLHSFGFNKLAMSTLQTMESGTAFDRSAEIEYRLGWRTETWDLPDPVVDNGSGATLYVALRAVHRERDSYVLDGVVTKCLSNELRRLRNLGNENLTEIRQVTRNIMCLGQIRQWRSHTIQSILTGSSVDVEDGPWKEFCSLGNDFDFTDMENIVASRVSLLRSARYKDQKEQIGAIKSDLTHALFQVEKECLLRLSEAAREANQTQIALNSILYALELEEQPAFEVKQEFANVLWLQREQKSAVDCLKSEIQRRKQDRSHISDDPRKVQDALILAKLGEWTSEACLEKPDFIHSQYFLPAIDLLVGGKNQNLSLSNVRADIFHKCSLFAEQQYHSLMGSEEIKRLQVYQERKTQEIAEREEAMRKASTKQLKSELTTYQRKAEALRAQDTAQLNEFIGARDNYLRQAIEMLSLCLQASDAFDIDAVIRMCSLWFANFKSDTSVVQGTVNKIPSRKFVFLAHQLSARLSASDASSSANQSVLQSLLLRMCTEHPFHSLYQVYSLQSSHSEALSSHRRRSSLIVPESSQVDRAAAAYGLLERLLSAPHSATRAHNVRELCDAYLEWAKYPLKQDNAIRQRKTKIIPDQLKIRKIKDLRVPVTTSNIPLDPSMRYDDCVWISGYQDAFELAGGVNLPKICICLGSDGMKYKQLFKGEGNDDMRQDAVMEQVFELCNQVLNRDQQTRKRELSIRSYKVIPLAPQAGLLEFVGNTRPLQFLYAMHEKYNKSDLSHRECHKRLAVRRDEMAQTLDRIALRAVLVKELMQIRQRYRPVMRHFFTEYRKEPQAWFEMRLKYSRSVAVSSIIGHILGLGDRHLSNILVDTVTGEVVHIDLGIAFEQGKVLPIPERVPFRLTPDMVDGFGMSGTDGVFRRCAEETLRVLRDGSSVIKTVLEVFKYDPLHSWTMSAMKIRKAQAVPDSTNHNNNDSERLGGTTTTGLGIDLNSGVEDESADRALSSVAKKLDKALSVEYTVNELIAEATDVTNLALMFVGWAPYC